MFINALSTDGNTCAVMIDEHAPAALYYLPEAGIAENAEPITRAEAARRFGHDLDAAADDLFDLPVFDGRRIRTIKRHIMAALDATPAPMVR